MRDRTAMTKPLTIGQRLVAKWEGPASDWSEPADLAEAIDAAIAAERAACAKVAEDDTSFMMLQDFGVQQTCTQVRTNIADAIRARGEHQR